MNRRIQRLNQLLRQELSLLIQRQLRDPRLSPLISITRVDTTDDLRESRVYVSVMGTREQKRDAMHGLTSAAGFMRRELAEVITLRHIPSLTFQLDDSMEKAEKVLQVMNKLSTDRKDNPASDASRISGNH
ncbi:MAG: 30S ribosome-binding factor RbfA [SAR202 cluster bacterium]|nr:30S ribosome-binding factor RbfA [SAR202 cluster bacterium]